MTHIFGDHCLLKKGAPKHWDNDAPFKTDMLSRILVGIVAFSLPLGLVDNIVVKIYIPLGIVLAVTVTFIVLFLVKIRRNRQIDWMLVSMVVLVLQVAIFNSCVE
jgi:diacylglycerol kinase